MNCYRYLSIRVIIVKAFQNLAGTYNTETLYPSRYFESRKYPVPPNSGDIATETIELNAGLLEQFPHCMEPHLRKLGLPTRLQRGIPELLQDFVVCTEGKPLTANQANILVSIRVYSKC